MSLSVISAED